MGVRAEDREFGGFQLDTTNSIVIEKFGSRTLKSTQFRPMVKGNGSINLRDNLVGTEVNMAGKVWGVDTDAANTNLAALLEALVDGEQALKFYSDRELVCRVTGNIKHDMVKGTAGQAYAWSAKFRARFPYWQATSDSSFNSTETGTGPHDISVGTAGGDAESFPVLTIKNLGSAFSDEFITLTHTGSLRQLQLVGISLNQNQSVIIEMNEGRVGDGLSRAVNPYAISGQFFALRASSSNNIELATTIGVGTNLKLTWDWRAKYLNA